MQEDEYDYTFMDTEEEPVKFSVPDEYKGESLLRFSNEPMKLNKHIPSYTYRKKEQMRDVHYKGPKVSPPEQPRYLNVKKFKYKDDPNVQDVDTPVPKVKIKEPRRSLRLNNHSSQDNNVVQQLEALNMTSTIWVPSTMLRKRRQWSLTNTVVAIPRGTFDKELPKPTAGMQGESLISDPNTEQL